jgi:hypothetical protein
VISTTDQHGHFRFGFGTFADAIPGGRHQLRVNAGLEQQEFGSLDRWVVAQEQRLTSTGVLQLVRLDPTEPFRFLATGDPQVILAGGDLVLDLSRAEVVFPDGAGAGDVHAQRLELQQLGYEAPAFAIPIWTYALQPGGIEVYGEVGVLFELLEQEGSYDYLEYLPDRFLLVGVHPEALEFTPVGVGWLSRAQHRVESERMEIERLDRIGLVLPPADWEESLARYANEEITLTELTGLLGGG